MRLPCVCGKGELGARLELKGQRAVEGQSRKAAGKALPFAIDGLQQRGEFFIEPGTEAYEGMIVGEHCKDGDLVVNVQRAKQLTNMRAAGSDRNMKIAPARKMSLEQALEYIEDDELVEVTPKNIRLRKILLTELERRRQHVKELGLK